jgi:hypothetical protein
LISVRIPVSAKFLKFFRRIIAFLGIIQLFFIFSTGIQGNFVGSLMAGRQEKTSFWVGSFEQNGGQKSGEF